MLHSDSFTLKNLLINKDTLNIFYDKYFWSEKCRKIPIQKLNINELQRYEKCELIAKNIIPLFRLEKEKQNKYAEISIEFKNDNIFDYLPEKLRNVNKEYKSSILGINDIQLLWITYDDFAPHLSYTLFNGDEEMEVGINITIEQLYKLLVTILYFFPKIDITDNDYEITYLPKILYECDENRDDAKLRYNYWKSKQWFI
jgi:hypothetical protein